MKIGILEGLVAPCPLDLSIADTVNTKPCCEIHVITTMREPPKNIRIGCGQHGYWLKDCFCSVEEAVNAWNEEMMRIKNENN